MVIFIIKFWADTAIELQLLIIFTKIIQYFIKQKTIQGLSDTLNKDKSVITVNLTITIYKAKTRECKEKRNTRKLIGNKVHVIKNVITHTLMLTIDNNKKFKNAQYHLKTISACNQTVAFCTKMVPAT